MPGEYKRFQNWIGGATLESAHYVPPPPREAQAAMDSLEVYMNRADSLSTADRLIDLALVHYQFEAIHPFADGNGRVGRMLITLMSVASGLLDQPLLYLSPVLEGRKAEYIDRMFAVSARSEWVNWITFFMDVIAEASGEVVAATDRVIALQSEFRAKAVAAGRSSKLLTLVDKLFDRPYLSVPYTQAQFGISYAAAQALVEKLVGAGILKELEHSYPRTYYAPGIVTLSIREI